MEREPIDPAYKYIDDKLKSIKKDLKQLQTDRVAEAKQQHDVLLAIQRILARFMILTEARHAHDAILRNSIQNANKYISQLATDAGVARAKASTSDNPLQQFDQFNDKYSKLLKSLGISQILIP